MIAFERLARIAKQRSSAELRAQLSCAICAAPLSEEHRHLVALDARTIECACIACALLFEHDAGSRYRTIPRRGRIDRAAELSEEEWAALDVPVRLAFFFFNSKRARWVAVYPSPAGPVESELPLDAAVELAKSNALFKKASPDVEAVLAHQRIPGAAYALYLVPIDRCYALVAEVRKTWRGFSGGDAFHSAMDRFFAELVETPR